MQPPPMPGQGSAGRRDAAGITFPRTALRVLVEDEIHEHPSGGSTRSVQPGSTQVASPARTKASAAITTTTSFTESAETISLVFRNAASLVAST